MSSLSEQFQKGFKYEVKFQLASLTHLTIRYGEEQCRQRKLQENLHTTGVLHFCQTFHNKKILTFPICNETRYLKWIFHSSQKESIHKILKTEKYSFHVNLFFLFVSLFLPRNSLMLKAEEDLNLEVSWNILFLKNHQNVILNFKSLKV